MWKESKPLVSVIVPVYNVKKYLEECIESIINQTYSNLEILLIDDGSTDGSSDVCNLLAGKDVRIKVVHQTNMGATIARKNGVICAVGKYICFVDADDQIDSGLIEFFVENVGDCDLITSGCQCENASGQYSVRSDLLKEGIYNTEKDMQYLFSNMLSFENRFEYGILPYLWNKMFKTGVLKELMENMNSSLTYAEDVEILFQYILRCNSIRITYRPLYVYRYRNNSVSHSINKNYMQDLLKIYLALEKAFKNHSLEAILIHQLQLFVTTRIYEITRHMGFSPDTQRLRYAFPFPELKQDSRIILYGAGKVGVDYYRQIFGRKSVKLVLWVDKGWREYQNDYTPVASPEQIVDCDYDYLVIAVRKKELADEIRRDLKLNGIAEEKILWRMPVMAAI